jgi:hypothetical protein
MPEFELAERAFPQWVNLVDFAMSALPSAIHDTGHSHIGLGQVCRRLLAPELQITGATAAAPDAGIDPSGARAVTNEPAYRLHEMGTESALAMLFPIFA